MAETNPFAINLEPKPFFDPDLVPCGDLQRLVDELWPLLLAHLPTSRKHPRGVRYVFGCLLANLLSNQRLTRAALVLPRNKRTWGAVARYKPKEVTYLNVRKALDAGVGAGLLEQELGSGQLRVTADAHGGLAHVRQATTVRASPYLREQLTPLLHLNGVVQRRKDAEVIHLRTKEPRSTQINYDDTLSTRMMREEVERINAHLKKHPCTYFGVHSVDLSRDRVVRIFNNGNWSEGGRLYGYWPMNLAAAERHHLRISGQPLADLDFASCFIALLHVHDGTEFNPGSSDPFTVAGHEGERDTIKRCAYAILNARRPLKNYPEGLGSSARLTWRKMEQLIFSCVPLIERYAYSGVGLKLMRLESDILVSVLLALVERQIGFVPMHDGIMVPERHKEAVRSLMLTHYHRLTGQQIAVKEKLVRHPSQTAALCSPPTA